MPTLAKNLLKRIEADLSAHPLKKGEHRRIPGMGSHYISLESTYQGQKPLFTHKFGEQTYHIFRLTSRGG